MKITRVNGRQIFTNHFFALSNTEVKSFPLSCTIFSPNSNKVFKTPKDAQDTSSPFPCKEVSLSHSRDSWERSARVFRSQNLSKWQASETSSTNRADLGHCYIIKNLAGLCLSFLGSLWTFLNR